MTESVAFPARALQAFRKTLQARLRAAGIHLAISAVIFLAALYLILVQWYPGFHFAVDGGWQGIRIMVGVDLVLGPALTLVIFNPLKARRLIVFDLTCIGLTQLAALVWGFYAVHGQRPVSINFYDGVFYSMPAHSLIEPGTVDLLHALSDHRPALIYVAPPANASEWRRVAERQSHRLLLHEDPFFFRPLEPQWDTVLGAAVDPAADPLGRNDLAAFLARHGGRAGDYRFFRYQGGYGNCLLAFNADREPVDTLGCAA